LWYNKYFHIHNHSY
jgi:hypothetical protein